MILAALLGLIPRAVTALQGVAEPALTQTVLTLAVAGVVLPAQRRIEHWLQRWLFVERHALERGRARSARDARQLPRARRAADEVRRGARGAGAPGFARDLRAQWRCLRARVPARPRAAARDRRDGTAARAAPGERRALRVTALAGSASGASLAERAALAALGAELIVPLALGGELLRASLCLGEKRSGDVYTSTDLALLEGLADARRATSSRASTQAEVLRQERALMAKLRGYVPAAVAEYIGSEALEAGEQEVTVLFVDIRGYSSFAEGRRAR